jgi:hypothetical protein
MTYSPTEKAAAEAQAKILGRFCTRCRRHKSTDGGATLPAGSGRTRWVCAPCLTIIREHKRCLTK